MTTTQLTPAQHAILAKAINTGGGKIEWFPDHIKGGARTKVLQGMFNRALITPDSQDGKGWRVAAEGYDALGMPRPGSERRIGSFEGFSGLWNTADWLRRGWNDFVLGFDAKRQSRMLRWMGVRRLDPTTLALIFAVVSLAALGWMLWWLQRGERERDPLLRAWHRLSRRYRRFGLARQSSETASDWLARVASARPQDTPILGDLARRFSDSRYADAKATSALVRDINAFRPRR